MKNNFQKNEVFSEACYNLGVMYHQGEGISQDYKKAIEYYSMPCDAGNGFACTNLGYMYDNGRGVEKSLAKAAKYFV